MTHPLTSTLPAPPPTKDSGGGQAEVIPHPCNPDGSPRVRPYLNLDSSRGGPFQLSLYCWSDNPALLRRHDEN